MLKAPPPRSQQQQRKPKSAANDGAMLALQAQQMHNRSRAVSSQSHNSSPNKHKKWASNNLFPPREASQATTIPSSRPATSQQNVRGHLGKLYPLKKKWHQPEKGTRMVNPEKASQPSERALKLPNPNQASLALKKKHTFNLHNNFLNLNPDYDIKKYNRAKALARKWEKMIGNYLVDEVTVLARKNFNEFLAQGGKLTYSELRKLNSVWKEDYINHITKTDEQATEYISQVKEKTKEVQHDTNEVLWDLQDQRDDWDREMQIINDNIVKNAVANGLTKDSYKKYKFAEFDILDMYKLDDGTMCYLCKKNLRCKRHGLRKRPIKTKDADFERA